MKCGEFSIQATTPTASIAPNNVGLFANASGYLISLASGGAITQVGSVWTGTVVTPATGQGKQTVSGYFYGPAGTAPTVTGLCAPNIWLPVSFNGTSYCIPAYALP